MIHSFIVYLASETLDDILAPDPFTFFSIIIYFYFLDLMRCADKHKTSFFSKIELYGFINICQKLNQLAYGR